MTNFIAGRDGGKTSEEGLMKPWLRLFTSGVPLSNNFNSLKVVQRAAGANMSVDVSIGDAALALTNYIYWGWSDAVNNLAVTSADPTNPRIDAVVAYEDLSVVSSASNNNPNALKFKIVDGTAAASPAVASDVAIQASVGAGNPFVKLATVAVAALSSSVVNANITDIRTDISYKGTLATSSWNNLNLTPTTVTALGNRSYSLVFNGNDLTSTVSVGERIRTTRNVIAPTQSASLNGTTQYFNRVAPAGTTFTDDFAACSWVKLANYPTAAGEIITRYNGTSGWQFEVLASGVVQILGRNAAAGNFSLINSYQSIPLNKWTHIAAQLDMSTFTATPTTSYVMIDGVDVPSTVSRGGTNPTALIQAGNLEVGSTNGGITPFPGKLAQVALFSSKVTQATMQTYMTQGFIGTETNLVSAYSLSSSVNDLNANANNLTANGAATTTNTDAPFGAQASGSISSTLDYGIIQSLSYSGNTTMVVQVPEGCTIPTVGGLSAVSYSGLKAPYGMPVQRSKWLVELIILSSVAASGTVATTIYNPGGLNLNIPIGDWELRAEYTFQHTPNANTTIAYTGLSTLNNAFNPGSRLATVVALQFANTSNTEVFQMAFSDRINLSAATPYYILAVSSNPFLAINIAGAVSSVNPNISQIYATNGYL